MGDQTKTAPRRRLTLSAKGRQATLPVASGADLRRLLAEPAEGWPGVDGPGVLALDEGLGGFLAPEQTVPLDAPALRARGLDPEVRQVRLVGDRECPVDLTRKALVAHWRQAAAKENHPWRGLLARAARLVTEVALGRGGPGHLEALAHTAHLLAEVELGAAHTLGSALTVFPQAFAEHVAGVCPTGVCRRAQAAPCQARCPSGIDIPNFMALTGQGRHGEAVAIITRDNPLPYACGLICPAPCESVCLRGKLDRPIHIRAMKAVSAKAAMVAGSYPTGPDTAGGSGKRVAVVGGGPAGLTCAAFLTRAGHGVTIFEAMPSLGGMMRYGIPEYRLPKAILDREIATIVGSGVEVVTGKTLGETMSLDDLAAQGFDAVFLAPGAWTSRALGLEGEDNLEGVVSGTRFLVDVGLGQAPRVGRRVAVLGGGNTAMDCARTALRLGAEEVRVVYRRSREEMPAADEEIEDALEEGVLFDFLVAPTGLVGHGGRLAGIEVVRMALGEPDASGRRSPNPVPGTERVLDCDMAILAIGQHCDESFLRGSDGTMGEVCLTRWRTIKTDAVSLVTDKPGVFAGGDAAKGPATVVEAVGDGKRAAAAIDAFLSGREFDPRALEPTPRAHPDPAALDLGRAEDRCAWSSPVGSHIAKLDAAERRGTFAQAELGLTQEQARVEAERCLRCDVCIGCGLCQLACSEAGGDALRFKDAEGRLVIGDFGRPLEKCLGCGACASVCPTGAMHLAVGQVGPSVAFTGHVLSEPPTPPCAGCGKPLPVEQFVENIKARLGERLAASARLDGELCPECARRKRGEAFVKGMLKV